jgi:pSer/pThr/pTyr-binding forkhead associated (FHA) protein
MSQQEFPAVVVVDGDYAAQYWILDRERMILGREENCEICIPLRQISRQHVAFIREAADRYIIEDLKSKNGTWVNGVKLEGARQLGDGDEIYLALTVRMRFVGSGITAPVTHDLPRVIPHDHTDRLQIDVDSRRVFINGVEISPPLSLPQYRLLELLYQNRGRVCTRDEVVANVWPEVVGDGVSEQAIDALVRRLRDRLSEVDPEHQYVVTVRGHGFRLE